jgi:hypothetical protein|tara:strand:+ start:218 stop:523 length:306 start_codon:yes stop_codon:yes gene_type:complete
MNTLEKNDTKRWFLVKDNGTGEESLQVFGYAGDIGTEVQTNHPILLNWLTEEELQLEVNSIAGSDTYYKDVVETENYKFQLPSQLYEYGLRIEEELPEDIE